MRPSLFGHTILFLLALVLAATLHAQTVVRVLQYNIHHDIGNGVAPGSAAQVTLAKIVNHLAPDVWTINELYVTNGTVSLTAAHDAQIGRAHV